MIIERKFRNLKICRWLGYREICTFGLSRPNILTSAARLGNEKFGINKNSGLSPENHYQTKYGVFENTVLTTKIVFADFQTGMNPIIRGLYVRQFDL